MASKFGFDQDRMRWSMDATTRLFPKIAKKVWGACDIQYTSGDMDKKFGVDAILNTSTRQMAVAIRMRGAKSLKAYGDITVRCESQRSLGKQLELSKSIARYLFYGWVDTECPTPASCFLDWHIVCMQGLMDDWTKSSLKYRQKIANHDNSSYFLAFDIEELRSLGLVLESMKTKEAA